MLNKFKIKRQNQFNVISTYVRTHKHKKINFAELGRKLGVCRQQAKNLYCQFCLNTLLSKEHGNAGKQKTNVIARDRIIEHYQECLNNILEKNPKAGRLNFSIYYYFLFPELKIDLSKRTVYNYLINANIFSNKSRRKTKKLIKKRIKEQNTPKEIIDIMEQIEEIKNVKPFKGKDGMIPGTVVEIDACVEYWIGKEKFHIYMAVDSATGCPLAGHVEKEETNKGHFTLIRKMLAKYGKPDAVRTDKRRSYWATENTQTHIGRSLSKIDIKLECSSDPTFKPNVERSFDTWQEMLIPLLANDNINSMEELDKTFDRYIDIYIEKNKKKFDINESAFIPASPDEIDSFRPTVKVKVHDSLCILFEGKMMGLYNESNQRVMLKPKGCIELIHNIEEDFYYTIFANKKYFIREVSREDLWEPISKSINELKEKFNKEVEKQKIKSKAINENLEKKRVILERWEEKLIEKEKRLNALLNESDE